MERSQSFVPESAPRLMESEVTIRLVVNDTAVGHPASWDYAALLGAGPNVRLLEVECDGVVVSNQEDFERDAAVAGPESNPETGAS